MFKSRLVGMALLLGCAAWPQVTAGQAANAATEALAEYKVVGKNAPNRFDAVLGADRPELAETRTVLARK